MIYGSGKKLPSMLRTAGAYGKQLFKDDLAALGYANERIMSPLTALAQAPGTFGEHIGRKYGGESGALLGQSAGEALSYAEPGKFSKIGEVAPLIAPMLLPGGSFSRWFHAAGGPRDQIRNTNRTPRGLFYFAETPKQAAKAAVSGSEAMHRARLTAPTNVFELEHATEAEIVSLKENGILRHNYKPGTKKVQTPSDFPHGLTKYGTQIRWGAAESPVFQTWLYKHGYHGAFVKDEAERSLALLPQRLSQQVSFTGQYSSNELGKQTKFAENTPGWAGIRPSTSDVSRMEKWYSFIRPVREKEFRIKLEGKKRRAAIIKAGWANPEARVYLEDRLSEESLGPNMYAIKHLLTGFPTSLTPEQTVQAFIASQKGSHIHSPWGPLTPINIPISKKKLDAMGMSKEEWDLLSEDDLK